MDPKDFDLVELCLGDQYSRGNLAPARHTWRRGLKEGYPGEAYHSGSFFSNDIKRHISQAQVDYQELKNKFDEEMADALGDEERVRKLVPPKRPRLSLKGYKGIHWSPFFMLDIDTRRVGPKWDLIEEKGQQRWKRRSDEESDAWLEENPNHVEDTDAARVEALEVIRCLEKLGVDPEMLIICFSGNKGFHIYVPTAYFNPEPCTNFIYRIRWMVQNALTPMLDTSKVPYPEDSVDWQVFDRLKVLRAVNSKHQSGGWKIPLAYTTLRSTNLDTIRSRATGPDTAYKHPNWSDVAPAEKLRQLWDHPECEAFKKPREPQKKAEKPQGKPAAPEPGEKPSREFDLEGRIYFEGDEIFSRTRGQLPHRPLCMVKLGQEDVGSGNRHQAALMLITTWWKEGYTPEQTFGMAANWLALQEGTRKDHDYLWRQIESVFSDSYNWSCNHPLAMANCFRECKLFPQAKAQREITLHHFPDLLDKLLDEERQPILYHLPYEPFKTDIKLRPKQVLMFVAETATGKTAFWLDVLRSNSQHLMELKAQGINVHGGCAMVSLEMPGEELVERGVQWIINDDQKKVSSILQEQIEFENDGGSDQYRFIKAELEKYYGNVWINDDDGVDLKKLKAMIELGKQEHGIGLWVIDYMGRIKGHGHNQHERLSAIARDMKTLARSTAVLLVVLVQIARSTSEKGPPGLRSGRGSGEIEESADTLITGWRADRHEKKDGDDHQLPQDTSKQEPSESKGYEVTMRVAKARRGGFGLTSSLWFEGRSMRFTPMKEKEAEFERYIDDMDMTL